MPKDVKKIEKPQSEDKEIKKQFESYVSVLAHKLGRTPTLDEVAAEMSNSGERKSEHPSPERVATPVAGQDQQDLKEDDVDESTEPPILHMKIYYGMSDGENGEKSPDEDKILFYERPDGACFDCNNQEWLNHRPSVLDHLSSRGLQTKESDVVHAILNGVMDDSDFEELDKAGMIGEMPKKLWGKVSELRKRVDEYECAKSEDLEKSGNTELSESDMDDSVPEPTTEVVIQDAGIPDGHDHISDIIQTAMSAAMTGMEKQIRAIVQEELSGSQKPEQSEEVIEEVLEKVPET